ncbi:hypothetical protein, partial [Deinococcus wulumuqiensis]
MPPLPGLLEGHSGLGFPPHIRGKRPNVLGFSALQYGFELYYAHPGKAPECAPLRSNPYLLLLAPLGKIDFMGNLFFKV